MKNISIKNKIWLSICFVMVLLTCTSGMAIYQLNQSSLDLGEQSQFVSNRRVEVEKWHGLSQLWLDSADAMGSANDAESIKAERIRQQHYMENIRALSDKFLSETTYESVRAAVMQVRAQQAKSEALNEKVFLLWEQGDSVGARQVFEKELSPTMGTWSKAIDELAKVQKKRADDAIFEGRAQFQSTALLSALITAMTAVLGLALGTVIVRQITVPLQRAVQLADTIAGGNLAVNVHDERKDELGNLLRSLDIMANRLRDVVGEVRSGVDSVSSAASQIAGGNHDLSARTEQTASSLEETAASIEELTATVIQSADSAQQANQLAFTAVQAAERGGVVVQQVVQSMENINASSRRIGDIIGVIDGIAFQTNILALNAAVEAARAGEQGRGFAVVASEVRTLAQRSAEAAKEIKALISASVGSVDTGTLQVAQAGESMREIVTSVRRVTDLIGEISASATEQRDGISQVNQAVGNLDQMTQQNAALVEQSAAAASAMNEQAQRLADVISVFKVSSAPQTFKKVETRSSPIHRSTVAA